MNRFAGDSCSVTCLSPPRSGVRMTTERWQASMILRYASTCSSPVGTLACVKTYSVQTGRRHRSDAGGGHRIDHRVRVREQFHARLFVTDEVAVINERITQIDIFSLEFSVCRLNFRLGLT